MCVGGRLIGGDPCNCIRLFECGEDCNVVVVVIDSLFEIIKRNIGYSDVAMVFEIFLLVFDDSSILMG